jgi:Undecaprenyl-phosphate glucose phosphotransferase
MSKAPRTLRLARQEKTAALPGIPNDSGNTTERAWCKLLRPGFVESSVSVADVLLIVTAAVASSSAHQWATAGEVGNVLPFFGLGLIVAVNFTGIMTARRNYPLKRLTLFGKQARETIIVWSGIYGLLAVVAFTMKISTEFSRGAVVLFFAGGLLGLLALRRLAADVILKSLANGSFARRKIIVVAEKDQNLSSQPLNELRRCGYHPVRTCEISTEEIASLGITRSLRLKLADVIQVARHEAIEDIYVLIRWHHHRTIDKILNVLAVLPVSVHLVPDENAARFLNYPIANIGETWTTVLRRTPLTRVEQAAKCCFDLVFATAALLSLLPLMWVTALLIKLDSRGPIFFLQKRNGFNDQTFEIFKFRTMHVLEDGPMVMQATRNDPRVTRLGRWLRRSSIDELPQLINVLKGDMSLVGPRPHATSHNSKYEKLIANYARRHHVKPGLTGWAQVNGYRGETSDVEQMERRLEHDLWYINNWSLWLDIRIVMRTALVALRQDTAF